MSYKDTNIFVKDFSKFWLHFLQNHLEIFKQSVQQVVCQEKQLLQVEAFSKLKLLKTLSCQWGRHFLQKQREDEQIKRMRSRTVYKI